MTLSRVVVLTDGLANTGVTNASEIASLAVDARRQGVRVSTIGGSAQSPYATQDRFLRDLAQSLPGTVRSRYFGV